MARKEDGGVGERTQNSCLAFMKGGPYIPASSPRSPPRTAKIRMTGDHPDSLCFLLAAHFSPSLPSLSGVLVPHAGSPSS